MTRVAQQMERNEWMKLVDQMQYENTVLKNELAEAARTATSSQTLEQLEYFQNIFITRDALFALLKHDIAMHHDATNNSKLADDVKKTEAGFYKLKEEFYACLARMGGIQHQA